LQRIYIFIIIAALIIGLFYSRTIREFFISTDQTSQTSSSEHQSQDRLDPYEQQGIELYRTAARVSDLQGKIKLFEMAKEKREWFSSEEYSRLDELIKQTEEELLKAEGEYQKVKEEYARIMVQRMLKEFSKTN
jgi:hypothetical protein